MLAVVADFGVVAGLAFALLEFDDAGEDFEEGGFAGAVGSDEDGAFAAFYFEVEAVVNFVRAVGHVDAFQADGALAAARGRGDLEAEGLARRSRFFDEFKALNLFEFAHGLGGLGGDGAEAVGEFLEGGYFLLLVFVGGELAFVAFFAFAEEVGVVAGVVDEFFLGDFVNLRHEFVHELAIVGNHQHGAAVVLQVSLKPDERDEVQVVGRFVEEEEVGFHDEEAGEVGAHDPAAGHFFGGAVEVALAEAEAGEDFFGFGAGLGVVKGVVLDVGFVVFGRRNLAGGFHLAQAFFENGQDGAAGGEVEDGFFADGFGFLGEEANHGPFVAFDDAAVGDVFAEDDGEKGGFAGAIGADEGDAVAMGDVEGGVFEKDASANGHF